MSGLQGGRSEIRTSAPNVNLKKVNVKYVNSILTDCPLLKRQGMRNTRASRRGENQHPFRRPPFGALAGARLYSSEFGCRFPAIQPSNSRGME